MQLKLAPTCSTCMHPVAAHARTPMQNMHATACSTWMQPLNHVVQPHGADHNHRVMLSRHLTQTPPCSTSRPPPCSKACTHLIMSYSRMGPIMTIESSAVAGLASDPIMRRPALFDSATTESASLPVWGLVQGTGGLMCGERKAWFWSCSPAGWSFNTLS